MTLITHTTELLYLFSNRKTYNFTLNALPGIEGIFYLITSLIGLQQQKQPLGAKKIPNRTDSE